VILKGARLAGTAVRLRGARVAPSPASAAGAEVSGPVDAATAPQADAVPADHSVSPGAAIGFPSGGKLTEDEVLGWLERQSAATRHVIAEALADELSELRASARANGFDSGYADGSRDAATQVSEKCALLARAATELEAAISRSSAQLEQECADVVTAAFLKVCGELLGLREAAAGAVREVMARIKGGQSITVRVHGSDKPHLDSVWDSIRTQARGTPCQLVADDSIGAGGCVVDTSFGTVDASFEVMIPAVVATLQAGKRMTSSAHG
jgi:flagellar biosynthesis/type III secretory pathway protein FliH